VSRPRVVIAEPIAEAAWAWLAERAEVEVCGSPDALPGLLGDADGLVVRTYTRVTAALLESAPRLRVVGRAGVGLDNIDQEACAARGVRVVNTPEANTDAVAEYVLAAALRCLRPLTPLAGAVSDEEWGRLREAAIAPRELSECTVGAWGLGRIGRGVARRMGALGAAVIYHDVVEIAPGDRAGAEPVGAGELLERSDVLTMHVDAREENRGLLGGAELARMKPDAVVINAARGMVVDAGALARWLSANPRASAALDVFDPEPIAPGHPLLGLPNALLTPHVGAATARAKAAMSWVVRDVMAALEPG